MTGQTIYKNFQRQAAQFSTDFVNVAMGDYLLNKALYAVIEDKYKNLAVQKNQDEISTLIKTDKVFTTIDNGVHAISALRITSVIVASATTYTIVFQKPHRLGVGISISLSGILGTTNANGSYSYSATPTTGQYSITNSTTISVTVLSATGTYTAGSGLLIAANMITDYLHLLAVQTTFLKGTKYTLKSATFSSPITIELNENNNLRSEENIRISGVVGNTNANGDFYIQKGKRKTAQLYSDESLSTPVVGNAAYTSGGTVKKIVKEYCKPLVSDERISVYKPKAENPYFKVSENQILLFPTNEVCESIKIDYITTASQSISCADNTIDLNLTYNQTLLNTVIDNAVQNFAALVQDVNKYELITNQLAQNTNAIS